MNWHTKEEKRMIKRFGGTPLTQYGVDGMIRGKPVEVRSARKDDRFRIQEDVHKELLSKDGAYILVNDGTPRKVSASQVDKKLPKGKWYKDRTYPHKFIEVEGFF